MVIKIWNPNNGTLKRTLIGHNSVVLAITTLLNGDIAIASHDFTVKIWNPSDGIIKKT